MSSIIAPSLAPASASGQQQQLINIRRDVKDAFYRYKMPRLLAKIEGRGNGIKTVLDNATDVARALNRLPAYLTKFFAFELGTLCIINDRDARYIVNGAHDAEKLQDLLDGFIRKFVLCQACENPETDLVVNAKEGSVLRACKACGHRGPVDMAHKLVTFIEKNPPSSTASRRAQNVAHRAEVKVDSAIVDGITLADGYASNADIAQRRAEARKAERAKRRHMAYLDRLEAFSTFLDSESLASGGIVDIANDTVAEYIAENNLQPHDAVIVVVQVLLDEDSFAGALKRRLPLLRELLSGELAQRYFMGSLERLVARVNPRLLRQLPAVLQAIYNSELIDPALFSLWYANITSKFVRKEVGEQLRDAAKPFIEWLEAEEDAASDDDEDDEEGEEN